MGSACFRLVGGARQLGYGGIVSVETENLFCLLGSISELGNQFVMSLKYLGIFSFIVFLRKLFSSDT